MNIIWYCSKAKVKTFKGSKLVSLEPELTETMSKSRDPAELQYYWEQWREQSGGRMGDMYRQYVDLYNEAAALNGFRWACGIVPSKVFKTFHFHVYTILPSILLTCH